MRFLVAWVTTTIALGLVIVGLLFAGGLELFKATWQSWWFLPLAGLVPLVWWWTTYGQDGRRPRLKLGTVAPLAAGPRGVRAWGRDVPGVLRSLSLLCLVGAMGRPVTVSSDEKGDEKGIDMVVVIDLSGSMRAVLDADPKALPGHPDLPRGKRLTRLDTAKVVVKDFIGRRRSDRMGVVVFGKNAYVLSPPTLDYHLLTQLVGKLGLNVIDGSGTAIGDALGTAVARLRRSDARSKAIILLTDGDNNAGSISPEYATHLAKAQSCKVYTIQIGTDDEVDVEDGFDLLGQPKYTRQRFPVNPELLKTIAKETGGEAYVATDAKGLADSMHAVLDQLEKTRFEASTQHFKDLFPLLLVPGVILLGVEILLRALLLRRFP